MRLLPLLVVVAFLSAPAFAQSSSSSSSSMGGGGGSGGSSGTAATRNAPSGTLRTGPQRSPADTGGSATMGGGSSSVLGAPGGGTAPGSSLPGSAARNGGQQAHIPEECTGPISDPRCPNAAAPTGTGLGNLGVGGNDPRPYGPAQSPVQGGPPFDTGPTGRPLDLPRDDR